MSQVAAIENEIAKVLKQVEDRAAPAKVKEPIWAEASYIGRWTSPKRHLKIHPLANWAGENTKVDNQVSRYCLGVL